MALQYLLDPAFQVVNTAGKPATGGYINVFIHGTRDRYYCASDFNGTLHPFNIPLDSLGSNVVLADDSRAYDVYVYNRYGTQLYSRYNVHASAGGGISSTEIISSDGSITVTNTANGVDLSVNGVKPSVLRAGTIPRTSDGNFTFTYKEREGDDITLDQGGIKLAKGWYHYDVAVEIEWNAPAENRSVPVVITAANGAARDELDLTFSHTDSLTLCGELHNPSVNLMDFEVAASGIPTGATVRVKEVGIHTVHGAGGGGAGEKNVHRLLRWYTNAGEAEYPAGDWLHDLDAEDPDDPSGHPRVTADQLFEWFGEGQNFELYEVDGRNGQLGWSAVYRMVTWQDQSDWWSQYAPVPGKAVRLEFFRMGMYSTPYRGGLIAYIRYKDEEYMRLYEIMPGQSIWMAEYQEKLPYYRYDWHNGDYLRVNEAGSGLEWVPLPPQVNADWNAVSGPGEILNKPEIPTKTSDLDNDSGFITLAEVPAQVNSDWNAISGPEEILNKPEIPTKTSDLQNDSGFITSADIPEQVNSDWDSTSGPSEILHKPSIPSKTSDLQNDSGFITASEVPAQVNADWNATSGAAEILNKPAIPSKTSDLQNDSGFITASDIPPIPTKTSDLTNDSGFITAADIPAQVNADWNATSGAAEILNKPAIPSKTSDLQNDSGYITLSEVPAQVNSDWDATSGAAEILNKPETSPLVAGSNITITETQNGIEIAAAGAAAQVNADWNATSGAAEILNKPTIPSKTSDLQNDSGFITSSDIPSIPTKTSELTNDSGFITAADIPAQVKSDWNAVSGPAEILNKPEIPENTSDLNNDSGFITASDIPPQVNSDWDAVSGPSEILNKPTIPTNTSDLNNDSGFITASQVPAQVNADWNATSGAAEILNKPAIPTATSDLQNDSGFITLSDVPAQVNSDWEAVSGVSEILNKPQTAPLVAGTNITITETQDGIEIAAQGGGSSVNADWDAVSGDSEILNKPTPKTLTAGSNISITETTSTITIGANVPAPTPQVNADWEAVSGPSEILNKPAVDQSYDGTSANAQSGTAVADAIGNLPTNLSAAQLLALKEALGVDETVLWEGSKTAPSGDTKLSLSVVFPETVANFEYLKIFYWYRTADNAAWKVDTCYVDNGSFHFTCQWPESATGNWFMFRMYGSGTAASADGGYKAAGSVNTFGSYGGGMWSNGTIWKVVGVHRIASN